MFGYTANTIRTNLKFILYSPIFNISCMFGEKIIKDKRDYRFRCSNLTFNKQHALSWCSTGNAPTR